MDTTTKPRLSIGFILADRFTLSAFANFVDVLRLAADEGDRSRQIFCRWHVLSATMNPVRSSCGLTVQPDARLGDPRRFDYVVVVGGLIGSVEPVGREVVDFLQEAGRAGVPLVGICTGAFILHHAGLMQGYQCCVSWFHRDDFLDEFEGLEPVSDQIFVVDRDRMTCSGGVSSAHLAAHLVERHIGRVAAKKSLNIMIIEEALAAERPQPVPLDLSTRDELVRRALTLMRETIEAPLTVARLAQRLHVNRRTLERHFAEALGLSPQEAARAIRLAKVKQRLDDPSESITRIAAETGFCDVSHLVRTFRAAEGMTPHAWRRVRQATLLPSEV
ncbi:GlxA family transcriptional regulator [Acuticoccus sp. M5D2P5]|uniref:GlxA family transcriptional regulator n=1 Tax=Acuticoccus kalidii TaxID=2910977 RepID=UPI001F3AE1D6|nr:GlxA family transcriptional regulator [Acuticoccus kalidii]MCF3932342.1 GlxA family transcriptional regulator [Acuticoccus kalidii]